MTGFILLLALADFWTGVVLCILSGMGVISAEIWQICLVCGIILVGCIIGLHYASIEEYSFDPEKREPTPEEKAERELKRKFLHQDPEIFETLEKAEMQDARSSFMYDEHD